MKTALIVFFDNPTVGKIIDEISSKLIAGGLSLDAVTVLSSDDDLGFKRCFERYRDTVDALIIADGADRELDLKGKIADIFDAPLIENEMARAISEENGGNSSYDYLMPLNFTPIPNRKGEYQGFMTEEDDFILAVLPPFKEQLLDTLQSVVIPYFATKSEISGKVAVFKCFGGKKEIENALNACENKDGFSYSLSEESGDISVTVTLKEDRTQSRSALREIAENLSEFMYADSDISLSETLFTLLKLNGLKISTAESFTAGRLAAKIVENAGASYVFYEGICCYSGESKINRLGVNAQDIVKEGAVSSVVAYQMAAGLLKSGGCDIAVATTGLSGPDTDASGKPIGLCYIAVGSKGGVHTYKMNLKGDREKITATAVNAALFFAVKNIKKRGNYNG